MKPREDIKREYKARQKPAGVFQIKNTANGKVLLGSSLNLEGPLNAHEFMLKIGSHRNKALQKDYDEYGPINSSLKSWKRSRLKRTRISI